MGGVSNDEGTGMAQEHWTLVDMQAQPMDEYVALAIFQSW